MTNSFSDVDVQITGMGYPLNWLVSRSATWMYGLFRTRVRSSVEQVGEEWLNEKFITASNPFHKVYPC